MSATSISGVYSWEPYAGSAAMPLEDDDINGQAKRTSITR